MWTNNKEAWERAKQNSINTSKRLAEVRREEYLKNPVLCICCNSVIDYKYRNRNKFCNQSCAARYNNSLRTRHTDTCAFCSKTFEVYPSRKYNNLFCSISCSAAYKKEKSFAPVRDAIERGETNISDNVNRVNFLFRKYLIEKYEAKCMRCGWSEINQFTGRIPIELEHKDGNCENNNLDNLELLCPNCHSLTSTYKGANRREGGSARYKLWKKFFTDKDT